MALSSKDSNMFCIFVSWTNLSFSCRARCKSWTWLETEGEGKVPLAPKALSCFSMLILLTFSCSAMAAILSISSSAACRDCDGNTSQWCKWKTNNEFGVLKKISPALSPLSSCWMHLEVHPSLSEHALSLAEAPVTLGQPDSPKLSWQTGQACSV